MENEIIKFNPGDKITEMPIGSRFIWEGKTNMSVQADMHLDCIDCGMFDPTKEKDINSGGCTLIEKGMETFCGQSKRTDKKPVYYPKEVQHET